MEVEIKTRVDLDDFVYNNRKEILHVMFGEDEVDDYFMEAIKVANKREVRVNEESKYMVINLYSIDDKDSYELEERIESIEKDLKIINTYLLKQKEKLAKWKQDETNK